MNRRDFIKRTLGNDASLSLKWAAIILAIILFFSLDLSSFTINTPGFIKLLGILLSGLIILVVLGIALNFISKIISKLIPKPVKELYNRTPKLIEYVVLIPLVSFLVYKAIDTKNYSTLVWGSAFFLISIIRDWIREKNNKIKEKKSF